VAQLLKASMPDNVDIGAKFTLRVAALDAATGNTVAGVNISNMSLEVDSLAGGSLDFGPFMLVPGPAA
jgi:hypothetical protein